ncbi:MAG: secondary thiamine-phosphate synthase enzyme YjbQ [Campylobacterales bacterium]
MTQTHEISIQTRARSEMINITAQVQRFVAEAGAQNGVVTLFVPHTTAAITINENADPDVVRDMTGFMDALVPNDPAFRHAEGNSDSHIKTSLFGPSLQVIVKEGRLWLGTWQGIYFCEFDGPRSRRLYMALTV